MRFSPVVKKTAWWLLFAVTTAVYVTMLTVTLPKLQAFSGGLSVPDMMASGYDAAYLNMLFDRLGEVGRHFYLRRQLALDMLYPVLFAAAYGVLLAYLPAKADLSRAWAKRLPLLPVLAGGFDYLENGMLALMLHRYPDISAVQAVSASAFTAAKSLFGALTLLAVAVLLALWEIRRRKAVC